MPAITDIWITRDGQPCYVDDGEWRVRVTECGGAVLQWHGRTFDALPAPHGHWAGELPPGSYVVQATRAARASALVTDRALVDVPCAGVVSVKLIVGTPHEVHDRKPNRDRGSKGRNTPPVAVIKRPAQDQTRQVNGVNAKGQSVHSISLYGVGTDAEDGALAGAALQWVDRIDGGAEVVLGTGDSIAAELVLKPKTERTRHEITLRATDSQGATGSDSVMIDVIQSIPR